MSNRINMGKTDPAAYKAMFELEKYWKTTSISQLHQEMIRTRASQINGCAFCIDMHTSDARKAGETERRIYALNAWRETPFFTEEERAILALTEAVTLITKGVPDEVYQQAVKVLGEQITAQVIMGTAIINAWNRIGISTGMQPAL
ncbi:alkylhydroperoxidase AhpD family core domain-containing protein [Mucilaginibacter mallensis]|uniref:Alkylhydroperoxidase AhpD family core domain-containing protein n=1 Tax=Mucilaginibacter mallensis TaxID=652787 RepID=A0A1H2B2Z8_MUCMA|nr:carboxymuconolactone decarboxylase family protein [Mucilaginibacter mallensis]SDT52568.1 alkylhydroperoxidase AhpD family core domain-containing protein [Mucilaginibacter mallensis]